MTPRKGNEPASYELDANKPKPVGETRVRRSFASKELTLRPEKGIDTVHDIMLYAGRTWGKRLGLAWRDVLEVRTDTSSPAASMSSPRSQKSASSLRSGYTAGTASTESRSTQGTERYRLSPFKWLSYMDALQEVRDLGSGLRRLGAGNVSTKRYFAIYSSSSLNWMMVAQACAFNAVPICTIYNTLPTDEVAVSLDECEAQAIFTNAELLPGLERIIDRTAIHLIVYDGDADPAVLDKFASCDNLSVIHINALRRIGQEHPYQAERAKRDDVFCCMFTSGGGGKPKGVLLTHGNICSAVGSVKVLMGDYLEKEELYLAFLPQSHILEFAVEMIFMMIGLPIAYGRLQTLTDLGVIGCKNDIQEARPSVMVGVPQVWETIRKGILSKVEGSGTLKKGIFNVAVKVKSRAIEKSIPGIAGVTDALVFKQVQTATGGRLRTLFTGGSSLARSTQAFLSAALVKMIQGYGLTEGTAMACILHPSWTTYGSVGGPVPGAEIKLVDRPEQGLGYLSTSNPPQGEIYVRGPAVFKGYFNRPDLDAEAFTPDRWFKTGDIGQWNKDGTLTVIDRVRNHVRVASGRFVAIERLESIYKCASFLLNGCVLAYSNHARPAMIIVVHPANLKLFAKKNGFPSSIDLEDLCEDRRLVTHCLNEMNAMGRKEGLEDHELLEAIVLTTDEWSPESGLLTAAQKPKRNVIEQEYANVIDKVYKLPRLPAKVPLSPDLFPLPISQIQS